MRAAHQAPKRRRRPGARLVAPALRVRGQDLIDPVPGPRLDDRLGHARVAPALMNGVADVHAVAQDPVQRALVERAALAEGACLRCPGFRAVPRPLSSRITRRAEPRSRNRRKIRRTSSALAGFTTSLRSLPSWPSGGMPHPEALGAGGGELAPDSLAGKLALELCEREQDVQSAPPPVRRHGRGHEVNLTPMSRLTCPTQTSLPWKANCPNHGDRA